MTVADLDGDCVMDLLARNEDNGLYVFHGLGDGSFAPPAITLFEFSLLSANNWVTTADFNRDGNLDVLVEAKLDVAGVVILNGDGNMGFEDRTFWPLGLAAPSGRATVQDLDMDGWPDLIVTGPSGVSFSSPGGITVLRNDGSGGLLAPEQILLEGVGLGVAPQVALIDDFDQDGDFDLAVYSSLPGKAPELLRVENLGGFVFQTTVSSVGDSFQGVAWGDINSDGYTDAYVEGGRLLLGNATGNFTETVPSYQEAILSGTADMWVSDVDQDGYPDIVRASEYGYFVEYNLGVEEDPVCQPDLGFDGPGNSLLSACGDELGLDSGTDLVVVGARPNSNVFLVGGASFLPTCLLGTTVVPVPIETIMVLFADSEGRASLPGLEGSGIPFSYYVQAAYVDPSLPRGLGVTNAIRLDFK